MVARVVLGSKDVTDTAGNDLVQFGPAFTCGPTERTTTPVSTGSITLSRPTTPISPTRTTLDGTLLSGKSLLLPPRGDRDGGSEWPQRKLPCSPDHATHNRGSQKQARPKTADRVITAGGGPEPWISETYTVDRHCGASSRANTPNHEVSASRQGDGVVVVAKGQIAGSQQADQRPEAPDPIKSKSRATDRASGVGKKRQEQEHFPSPPATGDGTRHAGTPRKGTAEGKETRGVPAASKLTRQVDSGQIPMVLLVGEDGGSIGDLLEKTVQASHGSRKSGERADVDNSMSSLCGISSACPLDSVASMSAATCGPSVSDASSTEAVSKRRSYSSLDTDRYCGALSSNANEIVRSHIEDRQDGRPGDGDHVADEMEKEERYIEPASWASAVSSVRPPSPPLKVGRVWQRLQCESAYLALT